MSRKKREKKFYAVRRGRKIGVFDTWEECYTYTHGFKRAEYKSFLDYDRALMWVEDAEEPNEEEVRSEGVVVAYVDGSYNHDIGAYGFGCLILTPDGKQYKIYGGDNDEQEIVIRNIAGETIAAMRAVDWAIKHGYKSIKICYDFLGICYWVKGIWRTTNMYTIRYATFMKDCSKKIDITFEKVKAHSGNKYNEAADRFAAEAIEEGVYYNEVEIEENASI